ncbi:MAG: hypothetical protein K0R38_6687 [Polyangiaceae bacterium]|nr:hypothetical protein [Polyangiaceae bacterium]
MPGEQNEAAPTLSAQHAERRALWHSLIAMLLVLYVAFVPVLLSGWQTVDCDRARDLCQSSGRLLGIATSANTFPASSLRGAQLVDSPTHGRLVRHNWDIVLETTTSRHRIWIGAESEEDDELQRELRAINSFLSGAASRYEHVSFNGTNLVALLFLLPVGWAAVRAWQLSVRLWRSRSALQ